jgi:hypothetical protein
MAEILLPPRFAFDRRRIPAARATNAGHGFDFYSAQGAIAALTREGIENLASSVACRALVGWFGVKVGSARHRWKSHLQAQRLPNRVYTFSLHSTAYVPSSGLPQGEVKNSCTSVAEPGGNSQ